MMNVKTSILFSNDLNLRTILFNTCLFFSNYFNFVCFILKKISKCFFIKNFMNNKHQKNIIDDRFHCSFVNNIIKLFSFKEDFKIEDIKNTNFKTLIDETNVNILNLSENIHHFNKKDNYISSINIKDNESEENYFEEFEKFYDVQYNFDFIKDVTYEEFFQQ